MEVSIFCPRTQAVLGVWVVIDYGAGIDASVRRAETLETVVDVALQRFHEQSITGVMRGTDGRNS